MAITGEQLQKWKALAEKAHPGPWYADFYVGGGTPDVRYEARVFVPHLPPGTDYDPDRDDFDENGDCIAPSKTIVLFCEYREEHGKPDDEDEWRFVAAAREAVPALIGEVERLQAELERLKK